MTAAHDLSVLQQYAALRKATAAPVEQTPEADKQAQADMAARFDAEYRAFARSNEAMLRAINEAE
ncbi:MAG TPA: hypothetical protein VJN18_35655 [Polyangiaceae bacterium]|nr:hypothetical protein [Polyangiaceae bacterium]